MPTLFDPVRIGEWELPNRIILAPLTRCRCSPGRVPNDLMAEYYRQRSGAGLILSEATSICPMGVGYPDTPGIWSAEQVAGWKKITHTVHEAGGRILLQLWHVGRVSDPYFLEGALPVAPSAIAMTDMMTRVQPPHPYVLPRALLTEELPGVIADYRKAAENALAAGFDGVELHGANGYLLDQFLQDSTNKRTDDHGGSLENRARLMLQAVDAAISVWGPRRVGLHLSPRGDAHNMGDSDPATTFGYIAREMSKRGIAFLCARESLNGTRYGPALQKAFSGAYIANEGFDFKTGTEIVQKGEADAVAYGRTFLANPDLPTRFAQGAPLNKPDVKTFYAPGAKGYTDYPALPG